ncbi:carbohydrate kinase family protein [Neolewinella agarilytica]|uniref:Fructokinase n=1 Tax=Neolewinella agarilytica TaxID=478744 RepID=A0A1H9EG34_9BACT|nr:carbohydrate kinase [Neolewinella agarilytica]SEQ24517.1 fructokinase [Neolewinella agarilytica]
MTSIAPAVAPKIVCFGETLFDLLPEGKQIGGAPLNVAYHFHQLGGLSSIVSRVGRDALGAELIQFVRENGLDSVALQKDDDLETGTVPVTFLNSLTPTYEIVSPVAWDQIEVNDAARRAVSSADAMVFGSLATRTSQNLKSLSSLLIDVKVRVLDVNLRAPFFTQSQIEALMRQADIVKVNDEEIHLIGKWYNWSGTDEELLRELYESLELKAAILTRGKNGAALMDSTGLHEHPGFKVTVADTIGAGDSFLAAFLYQYLRGVVPQRCLAYAGAVGALVASKTGGTPTYNESEVQAFLNAAKTNAKTVDQTY